MQNIMNISALSDDNPAHSDAPTRTSLALERHFTVEEVAIAWNISRDAVRKMFRNVDGVLVLGADNDRNNKRRYETLRIPQSVLERVHASYSFGNHVLIR
jgi:hypothetical protein